MRVRRAVFVFFALLFVSQTGLALSPYMSPTPPDCGKYVMETWPGQDGQPNGYSCQRYGTFAWFAAQKIGDKQVWLTQVNISAGPQGAVFYNLQLAKNSTTKSVWGGSWVQSIAWGFGIPLYKGGSTVVSIVSAGNCTVTPTGITCGQTEELSIGSLDVRISAPDVASLEAASAQLVYFGYPVEETVATWQVAVPLVFKDKAATKLSTTFTETPLDLKPGNAQGNNTSFAVVNLADIPQSVIVSIYDAHGLLVTQQTTPELAAGQHNTLHNEEVYVGGVYAKVLGDWFGSSIPAGDQNGADFRGTIRLEGSAGKPIAAVVLRAVGNSITSLMLKEEN